MEIDLDLSRDARAGALLDWKEAFEGFQIGVDNKTKTFFIRNGGGTVHSQIPIPVLSETARLRIVAEENIVEAYLNDRYSLAARVSHKLASTSSVGLFANRGPATISNVRIHRLKYLEEIP
jgi:hypothetical protein